MLSRDNGFWATHLESFKTVDEIISEADDNIDYINAQRVVHQA